MDTFLHSLPWIVAIILCILIKRVIDLKSKHVQLLHDLKIEELRSIKGNCEMCLSRQRTVEEKAIEIKSECTLSISRIGQKIDEIIPDLESRILDLEKKPATKKKPVAATPIDKK